MIPDHRVYELAACRDADPTIFDKTEGYTVSVALGYCAECMVKKECEALVRPRSGFFDGVAGGKIWRDGRRIDPDKALGKR